MTDRKQITEGLHWPCGERVQIGIPHSLHCKGCEDALAEAKDNRHKQRARIDAWAAQSKGSEG